MPRELLAAIDRDVERLLFAGAQVARKDGDLAVHTDQIAPLAERAPVFARLVEQVDRTQQATGKAIAQELLNLSALMAQVRGAQAAPRAPAGELAPLPPTEPIETPLAAHEATVLVGALTNSRGVGHRQNVISEAVRRGEVRDLRLLPFCVPALGDPGIAGVVTRELLPTLGEAILPALMEGLRIEDGKAADARRLQAIAAIRKQEAKPLLLEAVEKGSPEVRGDALTALAQLDPRAAEAHALQLLETARSAELKQRALETLGLIPSDRALDALIAILVGPVHDLWEGASEALARSTHPRATERIAALLDPEARVPPGSKPGASRRSKKVESEEDHEDDRDELDWLESLIEILGKRKDPMALRTLETIMHGHANADVRLAAAQACLHGADEAMLERLAQTKYVCTEEMGPKFIDRCLEGDADRAHRLLGRFLQPEALSSRSSSAAEMAYWILNHLSDLARTGSPIARDERWAHLALKLVDHKGVSVAALRLLAQIPLDESLGVALRMAGRKLDAEGALLVLRILRGHRDRRVGSALLKLLPLLKEHGERIELFEAVEALGDPALAAPLKAWRSKKRNLEASERERLDRTLEALERARATKA